MTPFSPSKAPVLRGPLPLRGPGHVVAPRPRFSVTAVATVLGVAGVIAGLLSAALFLVRPML